MHQCKLKPNWTYMSTASNYILTTYVGLTIHEYVTVYYIFTDNFNGPFTAVDWNGCM